LLADIFEQCQQILSKTWSNVVDKLNTDSPYDAISKGQVYQAINRCVNSKTKSYRYVLPTQLVAKTASPLLDCRCIQASRGKTGDFDARSVCTKVIVPFDKQNHNVLGGSPEPYVNNPLRVPEVSADYLSQQKDKKGWDDLITVLSAVETQQDPDFTCLVFEQTLIEIYRRMAIVQVMYPVPKHVSLE
jgi:hypothetical protein